MGAITGTKVKLTEFAGDYKILVISKQGIAWPWRAVAQHSKIKDPGNRE